jgi:hypothetical protein
MNTPILSEIRRRIRPQTTGSALRWFQRAAGMLVLLVALSAVWGRLVGVPSGVKAVLVQEFALRGLHIDMGKLTIDPLGGLVARDLVVYRDGGRKIEQLRIAEVELSLNWLGWREAEPILAGAQLRDGDVAWPLGDGVQVSARRVEAVMEFRPREILLKRGRGQILGFDLELQGRVGLEAGREIAPPNEIFGRVWKDVEKVLGELGGPAPKIRADFDLEVGQPEQAKAEILITGSGNVWRGVELKNIEIRATVGDGMLQFPKFEIGLKRGEIRVNGYADLAKGKGEVDYFSNADLEQFAAVGGLGTAGFKEFHGAKPPAISGEIEFDWKSTKGFLWQGRVEMGEFRVGKNVYRKLIFPWVISGKRWMIQGFEVEGVNGRASLQLGFDGKAELKGSYRSDIDLVWLVPWMGDGAKPFMQSLELRSNPKISAQITGAAIQMNLIRVEGRIEVQNLAYKGVEMEELAGNVLLAGGQLTVKELRVKAAGGEGTGEFIYGFEPEKVRFLGTRSTLPVQEFSKVFGAKFEKTMKPYLFRGRPTIVLEGEVDLEEKGGSNLRATLLAPEGMNYVVAGKELEFTEMDMVVEVVGRKVIVRTEKNRPAKVLGGKVEVRVEVDGKEKKQTTDIQKISGVDFAKLVKTYFDFEGYDGKFSGKVTLSGPTANWKEWSGAGRLLVDEGVLPGMGAFASAMNAPAEWVGLTDQNADMDFELAKGRLDVKKLNIESTLVVTTGQGVYDISEDRLENFIMRQNLRGPAGVPFFLVSQMFQYEGSGSLKNPVWKPRNFDDETK